jgi:hypothetical protein
VFPEIKWPMWRFDPMPKDYWKDISNQKFFFDWVAEKLNFKSNDDWSGITYEKLCEMGGKGLLREYSNSITGALTAVYPNQDFPIWNIPGATPQSFWNSTENSRKFLDWFARLKDIRAPGMSFFNENFH